MKLSPRMDNFTMKGLSQSLSSKSMQMRSNRMLQAFKVTFVCGVMTFLMLHCAVSHTNFTPAPASAEAAISRISVAPAPAKAAEVIKIDEEEEKVKYWDPTVPFRLGPEVTDWDAQRALWHREHPGANKTQGGRPRVLLVTGSQPKPCDNPVGSFQLLKSLKNKVDYCRLHDIDVFYNLAHLDKHMTSFWAKIPLLRKAMLAHPEMEWLWWMDSDALFTDMSIEVPFASYEKYNLVLQGNEKDVYEKKSWLGINAGIFLIRNCQWSFDLFDVWAQKGPEGPVRWSGGPVLSAALSDRPDFEADDQSALVHLLITERERWGGQVLLERSLGLHGYWAMIVEKYEDMMAKGKPGGGRGEFSWPFVTHFVGCKPCGKDGSGSYATDRCLKHMDRAFNFADNQILELYGLEHTTLNTHAVHGLQMDTPDHNPHGLRPGSTP